MRADKHIELTVGKSNQLYSDKLRLVEFYDGENNELLVFMTNHFEVSVLEITLRYQNCWQIEVFFKWIKKNLIIKKFWGYSENAVKTHLWIAMCAYLLVAHIKQLVKSPLSIYEIVQILSASLFDKTPLKELLANNASFQSNQNLNKLILFQLILSII